MSWWQPQNFEKKYNNLLLRAQLIKALRRFFDENGFWEVDTPALQVCPTFDTHIHAFRTESEDHVLNYQGDYYLQTSPEFDMKKLLVAGLENIYQICHVFRNAEGSVRHSVEFTLLEWYRAGGDYHVIMEDCIKLLRFIADCLGVTTLKYKDFSCDLFEKWELISVLDAFERYAGMDLGLYLDDVERFSNAVSVMGVRVAEDDGWDDLFFRVMAEKIEPNLGMGSPTILYNYPKSMAALSRICPSDQRFAERFELYICGVELANAYSELTDAELQRARFHQDMEQKKAIYGRQYPPDQEFFRALEYGMPESGGIALGVDRLVMLFCGEENIENVLWAPVQSL